MRDNLKHTGLTFLSGTLAGICIAIGGTVFLMTENRFLAAVMFSFGLFTICSLQLSLFTGRVSSLLKIRTWQYLLDLVFIWVGNWAGTYLTAKAEGLTRIGSMLANKAEAVNTVKIGDDLLSLFILAVFCNILIYIAVTGFATIDNDVGAYLAIFFGVTVFVLCGFEHCVADMYYFSIAGMWGNYPVWICIAVVTFGNATGGIMFDLALRVLKHRCL